jgi:hypothetical protein
MAPRHITASGLLVDGATGEHLVARGGRGRLGAYYRYYGPKRGSGRRLQADEIESAVWSAVADVVFAGPALAQAREWVAEGSAAAVADLEQRVTDCHLRARGLRASADHLVAAIAQGVDARSVGARLQSIEAELAQVEEDGIAAEVELATQPEPTDLDVAAADWCLALREAYEADNVLRARFLRRIISRIDVPADGHLTVHHRLITPGRSNDLAPGGSAEGPCSHEVLEWLASSDLVRTLVAT